MLEEILQNHQLWLETRFTSEPKGERADLRGVDLCEADLRGVNLQYANLYMADLSRANLQNADLRGANLDFASIPLWCGGLNWKLDKKLMIQLLYHFCSHQCDDEEIKELQNYLSVFADKFHRVGINCHKLESKK